MATEEEGAVIEDPAAAKNKKAAKHEDTGAADLEKITDYVEEAEISSHSIGDVCNCYTLIIAQTGAGILQFSS